MNGVFWTGQDSCPHELAAAQDQVSWLHSIGETGETTPLAQELWAPDGYWKMCGL